MKQYIKNIEHETPLKIADEISYQPGQVVSKTLAQNNHHSLTLFAFEKDEEISTHSSGGYALRFSVWQTTVLPRSISSRTKRQKKKQSRQQRTVL